MYDMIAMVANDEAELVQQACPHCLLVYSHGLNHVAGRYAALNKLIQTGAWQRSVADKYEYIYFPEKEVIQCMDSVNRYLPCSSRSTADHWIAWDIRLFCGIS